MANPLQIRSPKDLQETFKAFAQDNGLSQGDALELLLSSYNENTAMTTMPEKKDEMDHLVSLLDTVRNMFFNSLTQARDADANAEAKYHNMISSQKKEIAELKNKIEELSADAARTVEAESTAKEIAKKNEALTRQIANQQTLIETISKQSVSLEEAQSLKTMIAVLKKESEMQKEIISLIQPKESDLEKLIPTE